MSEWQPIETALERVGEWLIVTDGNKTWTARYDPQTEVWETSQRGGLRTFELSGWMPFPTPPEHSS